MIGKFFVALCVCDRWAPDAFGANLSASGAPSTTPYNPNPNLVARENPRGLEGARKKKQSLEKTPCAREEITGGNNSDVEIAAVRAG